MSNPKWWTETYEMMANPVEKLQYLAGLSDLSWNDCIEAWFEAKKQIPEVAKHVQQLEAECAAPKKTQCPETCYPPTTGGCDLRAKLAESESEGERERLQDESREECRREIRMQNKGVALENRVALAERVIALVRRGAGFGQSMQDAIAAFDAAKAKGDI